MDQRGDMDLKEARLVGTGTLRPIPSASEAKNDSEIRAADARAFLKNDLRPYNLVSCPGYTAGPSELDDDEPAALRENQRCTEYILLVEQDRRDAYLGNSIAFVTSKGKILEYRGMQASRSRRFVAPPNRQICGLGFTGSRLSLVTTCPLQQPDGELQDHTLED
eukprot:Skav229806  [mRNA]  locus=scaffold567:297164:299050:- [translate_table: standard]